MSDKVKFHISTTITKIVLCLPFMYAAIKFFTKASDYFDLHMNTINNDYLQLFEQNQHYAWLIIMFSFLFVIPLYNSLAYMLLAKRAKKNDKTNKYMYTTLAGASIILICVLVSDIIFTLAIMLIAIFVFTLIDNKFSGQQCDIYLELKLNNNDTDKA